MTASVTGKYHTTLHGQAVTVTVLEPGIAKGAHPDFRPNVRCKTYRYDRGRRKRRHKQEKFVRSGKIHPLIQEG